MIKLEILQTLPFFGSPRMTFTAAVNLSSMRFEELLMLMVDCVTGSIFTLIKLNKAPTLSRNLKESF